MPSDPTGTDIESSETPECLECGKVIDDPEEAIRTGEGFFCRSCFEQLKSQVDHAVRRQAEDINYSGAVVGGVVGGALGAAIWWGFTVLTKISFGLVAVVIGYLVGKGVVLLSGGKRSRNLQILSAVISGVAYLYGTYLVNRTFLLEYWQEQGADMFSFNLPLLPPPDLLIEVVQAGFGLFDLVFLAIVLWQAYRMPAPFRIREG